MVEMSAFDQLAVLAGTAILAFVVCHWAFRGRG